MKTSRAFVLVAAVVNILLFVTPNHVLAAESLNTIQEIEQATPDATDVDIRSLPIEDYPRLAKFKHVRQINFGCMEGTLATDDKMKALAKVARNLPALKCILLPNCRLITDDGIAALAKIASLKEIELEGTAITDAALETMATKTHLSGVNVCNCDKVTLKGLQMLATSDALQEFTFSADKLTQDEVLDLLNSFRKVTWCEIVDPHNKLDAKALQAKAAEKNFQLNIRATGALQDTFGAKTK